MKKTIEIQVDYGCIHLIHNNKYTGEGLYVYLWFDGDDIWGDLIHVCGAVGLKLKLK